MSKRQEPADDTRMAAPSRGRLGLLCAAILLEVGWLTLMGILAWVR